MSKKCKKYVGEVIKLEFEEVGDRTFALTKQCLKKLIQKGFLVETKKSKGTKQQFYTMF